MTSLAKWKQFSYRTIAAEISSFTRYYDRVLQLLPLRGDTGFLQSLDFGGGRAAKSAATATATGTTTAVAATTLATTATAAATTAESGAGS